MTSCKETAAKNIAPERTINHQALQGETSGCPRVSSQYPNSVFQPLNRVTNSAELLNTGVSLSARTVSEAKAAMVSRRAAKMTPFS